MAVSYLCCTARSPLDWLNIIRVNNDVTNGWGAPGSVYFMSYVDKDLHRI